MLTLVVIWAVTYSAGVWPDFLLPSPWAVVRTTWEGLRDGHLAVALAASFKRLLIGYGIAVGLGVLLGFAMASVHWVEDGLSTLVMGLQTVPSVVWLPLALLWFGLGDAAIIFVVALGALWNTLIATEAGFKGVHPLLLRAARTMGASGWRLFRHVVFPAAVPQVITGMRLAWAFAWRGLLAGELIGSGAGLGQVLMLGRNLGDMSLVLSVMLLIAVTGAVLDQYAFRNVERRVRLRWGLAGREGA